ncbi:hypothetical protein Spith_2215 [Spirochaeta thermophila DSM 6578]|uniref:Nitrogen regulatory protein P-II n=1 Tax=Winmispira thermophila (strain ATCC 700085 / DSM 6578 / Z-1203) TaxID=869211 RepID=G0GFZ4_WINT7|nr:PG0541 family transporter-associated protein [Spirochaeta thermophila]AEJ62470.1 hypothetical protein Spith_2215 [Spirochaeta thermophila DSM 6578]
MRRIEIIANHSVEEDLFDLFEERGIGAHYTLIPQVQGAGSSGPRKGDHIWPETNFVLIIYAGEEETAKIREAVADLKRLFPNEGIKLFEMPCTFEE